MRPDAERGGGFAPQYQSFIAATRDLESCRSLCWAGDGGYRLVFGHTALRQAATRLVAVDHTIDAGHQCLMLSDGLPQISDFVTEWATSSVGGGHHIFWDAIARAENLIGEEISRLGPDYRVSERVAVHKSATIEEAAVVKGPAIIAPNAFIAASAYLRGGVYIGKGCIVGPSCELKTIFMFSGSKVAHLSFVGDSIIGSKVNIEAGAIIANYRNEREDKHIRINWNNRVIATGIDKLGALVGDAVRIGANAVVAPGALLASGTVIPRLGLVDQAPPNAS